jgi:glycosyltransferase involved in cell wall biosynthesis
MSIKVSIITPTYNSEATVFNTLESVAFQSYANIEHIIVDGLSVDSTVSFVRKFDHVAALIIGEDSGIYEALNKGLALATGDIIGILNSDDTLDNSDVIQNIVSVFTNNPSISCVYGNLVYVNDRGRVVRTWVSNEYKTGLFEKSWSPAHPTFYCRRSVYENFGHYRTDLRIASDVDFMFKVLEIYSLESFFINENLIKMRIGGVSSRGLKSTFEITYEMFIVFKTNGKKLNIIKYLFYKLLKIREFLFVN